MEEGSLSKILIVDDEVAICTSCSHVLQQRDYVVETCYDGISGWKKFNDGEYDAIILDLKMPGMNGFEILEKMREKDKNVVIIVITGYATVESAIESMKKGAFDFLPKPFTPDELRVIIRRALDQRKLLLETERLRREKERMREMFVSMVSHQLKVPLVAVQQYFEVILGGMVGEVMQQQREILERSQTRISELLKLIDAWLSFSRIDGILLAREFTHIDITGLIKDVVSFLTSLAQEKSVTIKVRADHACFIDGHKIFLREAYTNLISNAINYNHTGGDVTITVEQRDGRVIVKLSDTGVGIEQDAIPYIFDEFYRAERVKRSGCTFGTGLGLSIVKRIIEAHGGKITVKSVVHVGSTFTVELPIHHLKTFSQKINARRSST